MLFNILFLLNQRILINLSLLWNLCLLWFAWSIIQKTPTYLLEDATMDSLVGYYGYLIFKQCMLGKLKWLFIPGLITDIYEILLFRSSEVHVYNI